MEPPVLSGLDRGRGSDEVAVLEDAIEDAVGVGLDGGKKPPDADGEDMMKMEV